MIKSTMIVGIMDGTVIYHIFCQRDAPSSMALSYSSGLMPEMAARYTMEPQPMPCQISVTMMVGT